MNELCAISTTFANMEIEKDSLEVRNYSSLKWKALIALIVCIATTAAIIIKFSSKDFWGYFKPSSMYYFYVLFIAIIGVIYLSRTLYYDKSIQLKIDREGIWTPTYKTWNWKDIEYFSTSTESNGVDPINFLEVRLKDGVNDEKNSLLFPLDNYDKSKKEIRSLIAKYARLNNVQDLGDETEN
jgi:hypothetical protein